MVQTQDSLAYDHFGPWDLGLIKLGKGSLDHASFNFQAPEPSASEEEDFYYFAMYFYGSNRRPPDEGPF